MGWQRVSGDALFASSYYQDVRISLITTRLAKIAHDDLHIARCQRGRRCYSELVRGFMVCYEGDHSISCKLAATIIQVYRTIIVYVNTVGALFHSAANKWRC